MITLAKPNDMSAAEQRMMGPRYQPTPVAQPRKDPSAAKMMTDMVQQRAMTGAVDAGETAVIEGAKKGYGKLAGMMATPAAPSAAQMSGLAELATASGGGLSPGAAQAVLGSGQAAAPLVGQAAGMTGAQLAGTTGSALASGAGTAAAGAGGAGMMAALGTAVPYIGAGLVAGKALGLFNKGGFVGPLSLESISKVKYKQHGGPVSEELELNFKGPLSR